MRKIDEGPVWATRGLVPQIEATPHGDTIPDRAPIIRNPLVMGDELWDAIRYLAPRVGIHIKRDDEATTQPMRRFSFAPLFVEL